MTMKPIPAMVWMSEGLRYFVITPAATTAMPDESTKAAAEPRNTLHSAPFSVEANKKVASCVLSPSSDKNTVPNTVKKIFGSNTIFPPDFVDNGQRVFILIPTEGYSVMLQGAIFKIYLRIGGKGGFFYDNY